MVRRFMTVAPPLGAMACILACIAACTTADRWEKPGGEKPAATDVSDCQAIAEREAARIYPANMSSNATAAAVTLSQQQTDTNRAIAQAGYFDSCMQGKGYVRRAPPPATTTR